MPKSTRESEVSSVSQVIVAVPSPETALRDVGDRRSRVVDRVGRLVGARRGVEERVLTALDRPGGRRDRRYRSLDDP